MKNSTTSPKASTIENKTEAQELIVNPTQLKNAKAKMAAKLEADKKAKEAKISTTNKNNPAPDPQAIDLAKVDTPDLDGLSNQELLQTIIDLSTARAKENPKAPHVGVNELAAYLSKETAHKVDGKTIRRKLQKIRKKSESYTAGKTGEVVIPADTTANPFHSPITIQWVNRDDRTKGIEYLVTLTPQSK